METCYVAAERLASADLLQGPIARMTGSRAMIEKLTKVSRCLSLSKDLHAHTLHLPRSSSPHVWPVRWDSAPRNQNYQQGE